MEDVLFSDGGVSWVAQDVICFDSFLDQKMFDKVIVQVSLSVVVMIF